MPVGRTDAVAEDLPIGYPLFRGATIIAASLRLSGRFSLLFH